MLFADSISGEHRFCSPITSGSEIPAFHIRELLVDGSLAKPSYSSVFSTKVLFETDKRGAETARSRILPRRYEEAGRVELMGDIYVYAYFTKQADRERRHSDSLQFNSAGFLLQYQLFTRVVRR
jgi:hypothetical protein